MGTQLMGSVKCITGNPEKSALVAAGWCVNTFTLACDHPKPNAPQDAHQPVLNVGQLRVGSGADSVDHHQRVRDVSARGEVIGSAADGVGVAIGQVSSAL